MNKSLERIEQQIHRFAEMMYHMGYDAGMEAEAAHRDLCEEERETLNEIHDGCDGCAHIDDGFDEEPCKWCRNNYEDKWEAKDV